MVPAWQVQVTGAEKLNVQLKIHNLNEQNAIAVLEFLESF